MLKSDVHLLYILHQIICNAALSLTTSLWNDTASNQPNSIEWWNNNVRTEKDRETDDRSLI
jgi:hypothetical protein